MSPRHQPHTTQAGADPYRSSSCRIGTHHACAESSPTIAPVDVPVIYESCDCSCHTIAHREAPTETAQ
ncbi:hypothetical protein OH738_23390 [Streptomyces hirsutus]|uniref:hypothetical protein n=1 Tax=Streptomyces hirsutus TaxID=35620 RepID=UPI0038632197|nr:hypothetical protein OH738_23390 [Streptomyces hirsutus]